MSELLAVYGTLRRGYRNHAMIERGSHLVGVGHLAGRLVHVRTPLRPLTYPGYLGDRDSRVVVEVYRIVDGRLWATLDALERCYLEDPDGSEYHRVLVAA